ncbi:hypothetical protein RC74_12725 [Falsihalocynthiibacter arcticus]|uniref:Uncharacterized protein n=1 Tax=Falsihalocynthiibacter arcticus TaxID=1579316 RepID=A0A126V2U4_9RHOB|nr:hypothetical protein RC74_12725 [Falsihalocynthiibacter arcticus]
MVQTGVIEAAMLWPKAALTHNMVEVAPYMLKADLGAVNSNTLRINAGVWVGCSRGSENSHSKRGH